MPVTQPGPTGRWGGLFLSLGLAGIFLAACSWWLLRELQLVLPNDRITASLWVENALGTTLPVQLLAFAAAAILCHALLGLAAFGLARLTEAAFPGGTAARRGWLIAGWMALMIGIVMIANATWHPSSTFAGDSPFWRTTLLGVYPAQLAIAGSALLVAWLSWRAHPLRTVLAIGAGIVIPVVLMSLPELWRRPAAAATDQPHIVVIGIDSLRSDLSLPRMGEAPVPRLREFLGAARRFGDATTPLSRTYGSWMSILTGRHPVSTNARYNLMPRSLVREGDTLPEALRESGYQAIYATDEVRFANIDESFGFQQLVTPPMGAIDFLLGHAADMPLINLIAKTRAGGMLFPSAYANRAAYVTYQPRQFIRRLDREIHFDRPTFLVAHMTLAHWPYGWSGTEIATNHTRYRHAYARAVAEVDRQFADVMAVLERKRVLENAVVVLLSDHGEALGAEDDSMLRSSGTSREVWDSLWGHGTSVFSPHQYQVLLAIRAFGRARFPGTPGDYPWPVTLEDLRPTLEHYARGQVPQSVDGVSLLPFLAQPATAVELSERVRFTETDFNTPSTLAGKYEEAGLIDEAAVYYELEPVSGWVQLREERLPELVRRKQLAALSAGSLLARVPDADGRALYLFTDRRNPVTRRLDGRPDPAAEPEAARLWDALVVRFPGEFPGASRPP